MVAQMSNSTANQTQSFGKQPSNGLAPLTELEVIQSLDDEHLRTLSGCSLPVENSTASASLQAERDKWVGRPLHQYIVEKWLGGGGMGQVYLARHRWLDVPVAIKVLNPMMGNDPEAIERFKRESQMAAKLDHPNIVRATDGGPIDDSFYLVTEFLDGIDLAELVTKHGPLPPELASWVVCETAKALEHAHAENLIHRDIKPSNIMLLRDGSIKLLDLGLARYTDSQTQMTATGQFMGTIDYVSPEQAADTRTVDHRADIYSLGCTLYYLLTGKAPFEGEGFETIVSKILAHAEESPQPIETFRNDVIPSIRQVVEKMMAKHPDDRMPTATEVVNALSPYATSLSSRKSSGRSGENEIEIVKKDNEWFENASTNFLSVGWYVLRTILSCLGILVRREIKSNSRLAGKTQYQWDVSAKGVATFILIATVAWFLYSNFQFIEVGP